MIFLCLALIYTLGVGSLVFWLRQPPTNWSVSLVRSTLIMLVMLMLVGGGAIVTQGVLGVLFLISLILYHVIIVQPLFLLTSLLLVRRSPTHRVRDASWLALLHGILIVAAAALAIWSVKIEPYWLEVVHAHHDLSASRHGARPIRVAVLADLQNDTVNPYQYEVINALMAQEPDLILIPGDLYDSDAAHAHVADFQALLSRLHAPAGVFMVVGDHDTIPMLRTMIEGTDVTLLDDEMASLKLGDRRIEVLGLSTPSREAYEATRAQKAREPDVVSIVLVHRPRLVQALTGRDEIDLVVAGHTHGGQINVPGFGPPVTISPLPRHVAAGGLHVVHDTPLYVSRGVGGVQRKLPLIRFNCRPEVSIITLE